jgi:hypothetical protein
MIEPTNLVLWVLGKTDFAMVWSPKKYGKPRLCLTLRENSQRPE